MKDNEMMKLKKYQNFSITVSPLISFIRLRRSLTCMRGILAATLVVTTSGVNRLRIWICRRWRISIWLRMKTTQQTIGWGRMV
jgi:hypothetical protein